MSDNPRMRHVRAKIGGLIRDRAPDDPELLDAQRQLAEINITAYVQKILDKDLLTDEQKVRLADLLRTGRPAGGQS
jgi:hypothetical protein